MPALAADLPPATMYQLVVQLAPRISIQWMLVVFGAKAASE